MVLILIKYDSCTCFTKTRNQILNPPQELTPTHYDIVAPSLIKLIIKLSRKIEQVSDDKLFAHPLPNDIVVLIIYAKITKNSALTIYEEPLALFEYVNNEDMRQYITA